jgi:hypothetical protein
MDVETIGVVAAHAEIIDQATRATAEVEHLGAGVDLPPDAHQAREKLVSYAEAFLMQLAHILHSVSKENNNPRTKSPLMLST